jgi:hypothetical protein
MHTGTWTDEVLHRDQEEEILQEVLVPWRRPRPVRSRNQQPRLRTRSCNGKGQCTDPTTGCSTLAQKSSVTSSMLVPAEGSTAV